jgi:hypothetical protein
MKPLLKFVHLLSAIGFAGGLAVSMLLAATVDDSTSTSFAAWRRAISAVASSVTVPSLVLLLASGMLAVASQPAFFAARWVRVKALIGALVAGLALLVVQPAISRMDGLARMAVEGRPVLQPASFALNGELIGGAACLVLCLAAVALAVWRPALGRRDD